MMLLLSVSYAFGQNYNQDKTALTNFLVRMYENTPFDGVKAVEDYDNAYLMSVVKLDKTKYKSESAPCGAGQSYVAGISFFQRI